MIRTFVALNADGHILNKSLLGLPSSLMDFEYMQCLCSDTLIMGTMDVVPKQLPIQLAMVTRKSLLAEDEKALSKMAASLVDRDGVGDISVLANEKTLNEMEYISTTFELVLIYPTEAEKILPKWLAKGRTCVESQMCGKYIVERYHPSVAEASDSQISDAIAGMESYFNMVDSMDQRDKDAIDRIAKGVKMLNNSLRRESAERNVMGDGYEDHAGVEDIDIGEEFDNIWNTLQMYAEQLSGTTDLVLDTQNTVEKVLKYVKEQFPARVIMNKQNILSDEIDGIRNQLGAHIEEDLQAKQNPPKTKRDPLIWVLLAGVVIAIALGLINLL